MFVTTTAAGPSGATRWGYPLRSSSAVRPSVYPAFLNPTGWSAVVIGGGHVAEEKVVGLLDAGCRVRVIARELTPALERLALRRTIRVFRRDYRTGDLRGADIAFATTIERP